MADTRTFEVVLKGNSRALARALKRASRDTNDFSQRVQRAAKAGAAAAAALGAALGAAAISGAAKLEKGLSEVRTLLPQLSNKGFAKLRDEVLALSDEMGVATDQAVPALYSAISAGVPPDNVMAFLTTAAKTAIGGVTDLETSVDALTTVVNTWGKTAGVTAKHAADVLFTTVKLGKTTMTELGASINQVAGLASAFGIEFEQVTAGVTELTKAGVPTTEAMTKMRALIQSISSPSMRAAGAFKQLGIEVSAARVAQEGILPIVQEIMAATEGNDVLQRKLFGSVEALQAALVLTTNSGADYIATLDAMRQASGATDAAFATMEDTVARKWEAALTRAKNQLTELGTEVLPHLADALEALIPVLQTLAPFFELLGGVLGVAAAALTSFAQTVEIATTRSTNAAERSGRRTRDSFAAVDHAITNVGTNAQRTLADRVPHHLEAGAKAAETFSSRTRSSFGDVVTDAERIEASMQQLSTSTIAATNRGIGAVEDLTEATETVAAATTSGASEMIPGLRSIGLTAEEAYGAAAAAIAEFNLAQDHARTRHRIALHQLAAEYDAAYQQGVAIGEAIKAAAEASERAARRTLSAAERLAAGLVVTMVDSCGAVTGFQECVDGAVHTFDADKNRILTDAERLAAGMKVAMTNACGTVTGFEQCVDGAVHTFDDDKNRILSRAEQLASGMAVPMTNACGTVTGFQQCVDDVVVHFDLAGNRILSRAEQLAAGLEVPITNACGAVTGFQRCVDDVVHTFDADKNRILSRAEQLAAGLEVPITNACGAVTGFQRCVDDVVHTFDADKNRILSRAEQLAAGLEVPITNACGAVIGFEQCVDDVVVRFDCDMQSIVDDATTMAGGVTSAVDDAAAALDGLIAKNLVTRGPAGMGFIRPGLIDTYIQEARSLPLEQRFDPLTISTLQSKYGAISAIQDLSIDGPGGGSASIGTLRSWIDSYTRGLEVRERRDSGDAVYGSTPMLPGFSRGAYVRRPTMAVIAEDAPEYVLREDMLEKIGSRTVVVNVENHAPLLSERDFKDLVIEAVVEAEERGEL